MLQKVAPLLVSCVSLLTVANVVNSDQLFSLLDYYEQGKLALGERSPSALAAVIGGADDEFVLHENRKAFRRWNIRPRLLVNVSERDQSTTILGKPIGVPLGVSPMALHKIVHDDGECATVKGAQDAGAIFALSTFSTKSIEEVAACGPTARKWFQLYFLEDRDVNKDLIQRAEKAGYEAIVLTVDGFIQGKRRRSLKLSLEFPPNTSFANLEPPPVDGVSKNYSRPILDLSSTWEIVEWTKSITPLKVIVKGILTPEDAMEAMKHGADGIVVSNHGGRNLDAVDATMDALPDIASVVDGKMEIYVDGGVSVGSDVFKAIALGAKAVFVGRAALWGLAVSGSDGVEDVLNILKNELDMTMALSGTPKISDITRDRVKCAVQRS